MGYEFEVLRFDPELGYVQVYAGESIIKALVSMRDLKRNNVACIQLLWRPL